MLQGIFIITFRGKYHFSGMRGIIFMLLIHLANNQKNHVV